MTNNENTILHVMVVGFHHRKGCQVEYCYPPLPNGASTVDHNTEIVLPELWIHLPTLAMPDGAHNVENDTVYFHIPRLDDPTKSLYCVSCYRQIETEKLVKKSGDFTRHTVQKSVCVISNKPLYGLIKAKLELITRAYFNERNFEEVGVLMDMYDSLISNITPDLEESQQLLGLSPKELVCRFKYKILVIFKLILLEKKILFNMFPVHQLCHSVLAFASLFPDLIEKGLVEAAMHFKDDAGIEESVVAEVVCEQTTSPMSPGCELLENMNADDDPLLKEIELALNSDSEYLSDSSIKLVGGQSPPTTAGKSLKTADPREDNFLNDGAEAAIESDGAEVTSGSTFPAIASKRFWESSYGKLNSIRTKLSSSLNNALIPTQNDPKDETLEEYKTPVSPDQESLKADSVSSLPDDDMDLETPLQSDDWGFPLSIFTKGYLCHPYLSLPYIDWLTKPAVRGYLFGATNTLFSQRRGLVDAIVSEKEDGLHVDIQSAQLRKALILSTADLRFCDFLVKNVSEDTGNVFIDGTDWEGGDGWIRFQFRSYLISLLASVRSKDINLIADFNSNFVHLWKRTRNYRIWNSKHSESLESAVPGHLFQGQLGIADVKLRLSHTMNLSEPGRKVNQTVTSAGKYVTESGKVVGDAFNQAKGAVSNWFMGLAEVSQKKGGGEGEHGGKEVGNVPNANSTPVYEDTMVPSKVL